MKVCVVGDSGAGGCKCSAANRLHVLSLTPERREDRGNAARTKISCLRTKRTLACRVCMHCSSRSPLFEHNFHLFLSSVSLIVFSGCCF